MHHWLRFMIAILQTFLGKTPIVHQPKKSPSGSHEKSPEKSQERGRATIIVICLQLTVYQRFTNGKGAWRMLSVSPYTRSAQISPKNYGGVPKNGCDDITSPDQSAAVVYPSQSKIFRSHFWAAYSGQNYHLFNRIFAQ